MTATDPDGDTVTYRLAGADRNLFSINATSGQLSVGTFKTLDFEAQNYYEIDVVATDAGGLTAWRVVEVTVTDIAEDPPCVEKDWRALVELYKATGGANWLHNENWSTSDKVPTAKELEKWHGVTLTSGCVTKLSLNGNNLVGRIPSDLGKLANLESLYMQNNKLSGSIPPQLGMLANLRQLLLYDNFLTDSIPPQLGKLANLELLYLENNKLSGSLPSELNGLTNLRELRLYDNNLEGGIPSDLGKLANLESLYMQNNKLTGPMPSKLISLENLKNFYWYDQNVEMADQLCAPTDKPFQDWLVNINDFSGDNCVTVRARRTKRSVSAPRIMDVSIVSEPGPDGIYTATERIEVAIRFDLPVFVTGSPHLILSVGIKAVSAQPVAVGRKADALMHFRYMVVKGDYDANGVSINADALQLNGGSITGFSGAAAELGLNNHENHEIKDAAKHIVDARDKKAEKAVVEDTLAAQGRAYLASVIGVIGERFRAWTEAIADGMRNDNGLPIRPGAMGARALTAGGGGTASCRSGMSGKMALTGEACAAQPFRPKDSGPGRGIGNVSLGSIGGENFAIPFSGAQNESTNPGWTLWGAHDVQKFRGATSRGSYDGDLRLLYLGIDGRIGDDWLAGLALSASRGETEYGFTIDSLSRERTLRTSLTSIYLYSHGWLSSGLEVWGITGLGGGEVVLESDGFGSREIGGLGMGLGAFGVRQDLMEFDTLKLSLFADAGIAQLQTDAGSQNRTLDDLSAMVTRVRVGVEGEYDLALASGGSLRPFWQVNGRYDGGDGLTGVGLELAGGVLYDSERLEAQVQVRWLAVHSSASKDEFGASATLRIKPNADGLGLTAALSPQWGVSGVSTKSIWGPEILRKSHDKATKDRKHGVWSMDGRMEYGIAMPRYAGVLRPFGELRLAGESLVHQRFGVRLDQSVDRGSLGVELGAARVARPNYGTTSIFDLTIEARF